ncbi:MAG: hybrid sensor histidine kinase/response regulator, partial [Burkholderiales bacterium]|nr:hybrid sensor histidine kinase/response regulator [Burkholderiales bacterium]
QRDAAVVRLAWRLACALACAAPAVALADAEARPALAFVVSLLGLALGDALAPLRRAYLVGALLQLAAFAPVALAGGWRWAGVALLATAAAAAWAAQRRADWLRDTALRWRAGEDLERTRGERDEALGAGLEKSRFLAIASHDLRQPVHALGLFAATLQKRLQRTPDEALARNLMRAIDGLERSFSAILDISRLDGGAVAPHLQTFPLRDIFRRLHMHYAGQAEFVGLGLRFAPGCKSVTSDPQLLERIVGNLVQNAIKYTAHGGVVVVARSTASHVNVEVWDTGCGIAAHDLGRIFEEFYQAGRSDRDRVTGLGMGLTIVKRLCELMNLRLEVASTPGRGTMFRVGVPIGGLPGIQEELVAADTLPMAIETQRMVLVVDDEEPIREGLRLLLQEWGYQAMTAADAAQAEAAVADLEGRVDLVLSDLHLGGGPDGQQVIASVRRLCGREVPAILVTGDTAVDTALRVAASGDPVLVKPVQPRRLFDAMQAVMH